MRLIALIPLLPFVLAGGPKGNAADTNAIAAPSQEVSLASLPSVQELEYRADAYIEAAGKLQAMGKEAASNQLLLLARSPLAEATKRWEADGGVNEEAFKQMQTSRSSLVLEEQKVAVLCRMLFTRRPGSDFKPPNLGAPSFLGGGRTSDPKWSLEPIELVDGVPFAVVQGYGIEGHVDPRSAELYVRYCMTNCDWSNTRFTVKSKTQKEAALQKLISSSKWERPLCEGECEYLRKQLE